MQELLRGATSANPGYHVQPVGTGSHNKLLFAGHSIPHKTILEPVKFADTQTCHKQTDLTS